MTNSPTSHRILGFDLARSIAIFGMFVHHFQIAMTSESSLVPWQSRLMRLFDGRPASLFLVLAGIGVTLYSRRAVNSGNTFEITRVRRILINRGLVLLVLGCLNLLIWPGDILRVYGISLLLAPWFIDKPARWLIMTTVGLVIGFGLLLSIVDYEQNWDWSTMTYHRLWSPSGFVRNLFYDGFRSVFPWCGFLFFGMWLGRQDLRNRNTNSRFLSIGLSVMIFAEVTSAILVSTFGDMSAANNSPSLKIDNQDNSTSRGTLANIERETTRQAEIQALFGTDSIPPLPLFLAAAGGLAVFLIALSIRIADHWPHAILVRSLSATGQLALTWYFCHIYIGLGSIVVFQEIGNRSLGISISCAIGFFTLAVCCSLLWKRHFQFGPLEGIMRVVTGSLPCDPASKVN